MKKTIFIFTVLLSLYCNAQNSNKKNNNQKQYIMEKLMKMPEFNADHEIFDRENYFLNRDSVHTNPRSRNERRTRVVGNDTLNISASTNIYREIDKNGRVRRGFLLESDGRVIGEEVSTNPLIRLLREFYPTGGIKTKGLINNFGFRMGLWYHFDLDGNLIRTENYDEGFEFTMEDIFSYCLDNNIPLERAEPGRSMGTEITRGKIDNRPAVWFITYPDYTKGKMITIQIDGKTGEIIRVIERNFPIV